MRPLRTVLLPIVIAAPGCVESLGQEKPAPPDMSALVRAYLEPTAPLDQATLDALLEPLRLKLEVALELEDLDAIREEVVEPATEAAAGDGEEDGSPFGLRAEGFARLHHVCRGLEPEAPPDREANGYLELVMTFTEEGIDDVIWGVASGCRMPLGGREAVLDGQVSLHLPERIFDLHARLEVDGRELVDGGFDLRFAGGIELSLAVPAGNVVFFVGARGLGFRAADGVWDCDLPEERCSREADGAVLILRGISL